MCKILSANDLTSFLTARLWILSANILSVKNHFSGEYIHTLARREWKKDQRAHARYTPNWVTHRSSASLRKIGAENMVRPERFELPTFWFVASGRIQYLVGPDSLTNSRARFICPPVVP